VIHEAPRQIRRVKYLVVDDHGASRQLIRDFLPGTDSEVVECADGVEAVAAFQKESPDWVLMDIEMPGMDGLSALRAILSLNPDARVVIVTQHDTPVLRREAMASGAAGFIPKDDLTQLRHLLQSRPPQS
jgi:CheY-like chemotaxis protein